MEAESKTLAVRVPIELADAAKAAALEAGTTQSKWLTAVIAAALLGRGLPDWIEAKALGAPSTPEPAEPKAEPEPEPEPTWTWTRMIRRSDGHCQVFWPGTNRVEITGDEARCRELAEQRWPGIRLDVEETARAVSKAARKR